MIRTHTILKGQSIIDVAMQVGGSAEFVMNLWRHNPDLALDEELVAGETLTYDDAEIIDQQVVNKLAELVGKVSTGSVQEAQVPQNLIATSITLTDIDLQWDASDGSGYILERRVDDGDWEQIVSQPETTYEDTDI